MKKNIWDEFCLWMADNVDENKRGVFWADIAAGAVVVWFLGTVGIVGYWAVRGLYAAFQFSTLAGVALTVLTIPVVFWLVFLATRETEE
jgi:hypothetical protein